MACGTVTPPRPYMTEGTPGTELWTSRYLLSLAEVLTPCFGKEESTCSEDRISTSKHFKNVEISGWWVTYKNPVPALVREIHVFFYQIKLLPFRTHSGILDQLFVKTLLLALGRLCLGRLMECSLDLWHALYLFWAISPSFQHQGGEEKSLKHLI